MPSQSKPGKFAYKHETGLYRFSFPQWRMRPIYFSLPPRRVGHPTETRVAQTMRGARCAPSNRGVYGLLRGENGGALPARAEMSRFDKLTNPREGGIGLRRGTPGKRWRSPPRPSASWRTRRSTLCSPSTGPTAATRGRQGMLVTPWRAPRSTARGRRRAPGGRRPTRPRRASRSAYKVPKDGGEEERPFGEKLHQTVARDPSRGRRRCTASCGGCSWASAGSPQRHG